MKELLLFDLLFLFIFSNTNAQNKTNYAELAAEAEVTLEKAVAYFQTQAIEGGYVYFYTLGWNEKWGEGKTLNPAELTQLLQLAYPHLLISGFFLLTLYLSLS